MKKRASSCPISNTKVDERVARLNGLVSLFFVLGGMYLPMLWMIIAIDFFVRSINPKSSLVSKFNRLLLSLFKGKPVLIDAAPKKFAAVMGLGMSLLLIIFHSIPFAMGQTAVLWVFMVAILMEVIFKYCIGCKIYAILLNLRLVK